MGAQKNAAAVQFSISKQVPSRNVERFRGGLVSQAHRLVYHSRLEGNKEEEKPLLAAFFPRASSSLHPGTLAAAHSVATSPSAAALQINCRKPGLRGDSRPHMGWKSVALSVGTPVRPYGTAYGRVYGFTTPCDDR
jgi:hypothetical protein